MIDETLARARESRRKRAVYCFHEASDRLQRMINAGLQSTYITPHKHENPDKLEIVLILRGSVGVLFYGDDGSITRKFILDERGPVKAVEVPPKTWHNFIVLSSEAAVYEIIDGIYDPKTHKKFAPWAPAEDSAESRDYLEKLRKTLV